MAILTLPKTSIDNIANEAILETCMKHTTDKLSIVLRCPDNFQPKLNELRRYVGEIYSMAWDVVLNVQPPMDPKKNQSTTDDELLNIIIYPQNLPNAAPENWITHRPDLDCICSHSSIIGWSSSTTMSSSSTGQFFLNVEGSGVGGLQSHVDAVNNDRKARGLGDVYALDVENWPDVCCLKKESATSIDGSNDHVLFLEDDNNNNNGEEEEEEEEENENAKEKQSSSSSSDAAIGHYRIPSSSLYNSVAVGGTFDGVHYGHRKLLTLAISSVVPNSGKLIIGITTDEMLQQKDFAEYIPNLKQRMKDVRAFVDDLAPGMKNRIKIVPIKDKYGPPGTDPKIVKDLYDGMENDFDALVLSHETLPTGSKLNEYRVKELGLQPLTLLCTRRTEAHGMSSTTLRRIRSQK